MRIVEEKDWEVDGRGFDGEVVEDGDCDAGDLFFEGRAEDGEEGGY